LPSQLIDSVALPHGDELVSANLAPSSCAFLHNCESVCYTPFSVKTLSPRRAVFWGKTGLAKPVRHGYGSLTPGVGKFSPFEYTIHCMGSLSNFP